MTNTRLRLAALFIGAASVLAAVGTTGTAGAATAKCHKTHHAKVCKARVKTTKTTTTTVSNAAVGQQLVAIFNNVNAQSTSDANDSNWSGLSAVYNTAAQQVAALHFPANAKADAKAVVKDLNVMSEDAAEIPSAGTSNLESVLGTAHADDDSLRADLGLPAATGG